MDWGVDEALAGVLRLSRRLGARLPAIDAVVAAGSAGVSAESVDEEAPPGDSPWVGASGPTFAASRSATLGFPRSLGGIVGILHKQCS